MREVPGSAGTVVLGILVGLLSTCVQSIGITQQRKSHLLEDQKLVEEDGHVHRPPYRRRRWQLGMLMFLIANIVGSSIQITTLPLPVLSTLQASGLVFNTICATVILGEPFTRYSLVGTCLVAAGALLIGIFGSLTEPPHNLEQLLYLLGRPQFLTWLFGTLFVVLLIMIGTFLMKKIHPRHTHRARLIEGMAYGSISGILSAHCLLLAKSAVELLVRTIVDHHNQFKHWQSWMILLGLVFLALSQLYYLHRGLKLCSTSVLYPFVFCIYNIIAIVDGLIYFDQGSRLSAVHAGLIAVGTVVLLGGVFALSWRLQADDHIPGPAAVDIRAKARVPTPRTFLEPGLGLLDSGQSDDDVFLQNDEEALRHGPNENTPLLRTATAPAGQLDGSKGRDSLRVPKMRRLTTIDDRDEIWDDLHDRSDNRRYSGGPYSPHSIRSPSSSRLLDRRSHSGPRKANTMPIRRQASLNKLSNIPWRFWKGTLRGQKRASQDFLPPPPLSDHTDGDDTEGETEAPVRRASGWSLGGRRRSESEGTQEQPAWLKLKWWKKRWRNGGDGDNDGGGT